MAHASPEALQRILPLLRRLRDLPGLREVKPGIFYSRGAAFLHFHEEGEQLVADLKKRGGGFDRYPLANVNDERRLLDDARRRAARSDEDD